MNDYSGRTLKDACDKGDQSQLFRNPMGRAYGWGYFERDPLKRNPFVSTGYQEKALCVADDGTLSQALKDSLKV